ncbi:MAG: hypothetical protein IT305_11255 [Chloroflexi bacterium]|nr:hypothetical protein [Chloroflexota bacterium]
MRLLRPLVALVLAATALLTVGASSAMACSAALTRDRLLDVAVPQATVIAEGWIESVNARADLPSGIEDRVGNDLFVPVEMVVRVAQIHKGAIITPLVFYGQATRRPGGDVGQRADGSLDFPGQSLCAWPDSDPTGAYALLVLERGRQDRLTTSGMSGTRAYSGPNDPRLAADRNDILRRIPSDASATLFDPARQQQTTPDILGAAAVAIPLMLIAGGAFAALYVLGRRSGDVRS